MMRTFMRTRRYSWRTEQAYIDRVRRFILFHGKRHPRELAEKEVVEFPSDLAVKRKVSASTQNLLRAFVFVPTIFERKLGRLDGVLRASEPARLPVVLSRDEVRTKCDRFKDFLKERFRSPAIHRNLLYASYGRG